MSPNPTLLGPLENKGERIPKGLVGSQPHKFVRSRFNRAAKLFPIGVADFGVEPVAGYDEVRIGEASVDVVQLDLLLKVQSYPQLPRPLMEQLQEPLSTETNEAVPARALHLSRYVAVDEIPVNEFVDDALGTHRVVRRDVVHGLIRKDDSPAKGVVGFVALVDLNVMLRISEL